MKKTGLFVFIVSLLLIFTMLAIQVSAAGAVATTDSKSCAKGGTVTLNLSLSGASEVLSGAVEVMYDASVLKLVSAQWHTDGALLSTFDQTTEKGAFAFQSEKRLSGRIFSVTFQVLDQAPIGKTEVECRVQLKNGSGDITVSSQAGGVSVTCKHSFTEKNNKYLAGAATCTSPARYYYTCSLCGEKGTATYTVGSSIAHTFNKQIATSAYLVNNVTCVNTAEYYFSCACGAKGAETFTADASWSHNFSNHWFVSGDGHWHGCLACGEQKDFANHEKNSDGVCKTCHFVLSEDGGHEHAFSEEWSKSEDAHWHECSCGIKDGLALHNWNESTEADGRVTYTCTDCGQTKTETAAHKHAFSEEWSKSEDAHWHECSCGIKDGMALHSWNEGSEADGQVTYTCTDCGQTKTETAAHKHAFSEDWSKSEDAHWHECSCGIKDGMALHSWNEGSEADGRVTYTCTDCGQTRTETVETPDEKPGDTTSETTATPPDPSAPDTDQTPPILIALAGVGILLVLEAIGLGVYFLIRKKKRSAPSEPIPESHEEE